MASLRIDPNPGFTVYPPLSPKFSPSAPPAFLTPNPGPRPPYSSSTHQFYNMSASPQPQHHSMSQSPQPPQMQPGIINVPVMEYSVPGTIQAQPLAPPPQPVPQALKPMSQPPPAPALNEVYLNEERVRVRCPYCHASVTTKVSYTAGMMSHIAAFAILFVFCPLAWVPYCGDCCKDVDHSCPNCGRAIGKFKRFQ